ncbi:T-cell activation inhibitor, mitochondrial isoform X1 [Pleurodeles waltl]|uniref:T-cell activation inhibitor, mitochondrial isoform X1 n=1 Tax=Pleurodeles waltl TaxID=8319 RepID=UPI003709714A
MFCISRTIKRWCLHEVFQARALSGADAVNALRPFYFAVHPDFFGQHPREREVNENSLKRLNGYLENLQKPGFRTNKPTPLTFYVRETDQTSVEVEEPIGSPGFRAVCFTLHTRDLLSAVLDILNSCSLPTEHMKDFSGKVDSQPHKRAQNAFYRPIKWDKTYYSFTGFKDPEEELEQAQKMETTLSSWLDSIAEVAAKKLKNSFPLRDELERLKADLIHHLHLSDIRWQRSWGIAHRCSQLHSLSRLSQQSPETLLNVKGCTVIFTDFSGMSAAGHIMLGTMDVHHHWTELFERLPSYYRLQRKLVLLEDQISHLLGGMQLLHTEELQPLLSLEEYYVLLDAFCNKLLSTRLPFHPRSLHGLQMVLQKGELHRTRDATDQGDRHTPQLHELGHFIVPTNCDLISLQWFILTKAQQAKENLKLKDELKVRERELNNSCIEKFSLRRLHKETGISNAQMIDCCTRLLNESLPHLQGMHLCVSRFYSVLQDGDLCIPWNWKS